MTFRSDSNKLYHLNGITIYKDGGSFFISNNSGRIIIFNSKTISYIQNNQFIYMFESSYYYDIVVDSNYEFIINVALKDPFFYLPLKSCIYILEKITDYFSDMFIPVKKLDFEVFEYINCNAIKFEKIIFRITKYNIKDSIKFIVSDDCIFQYFEDERNTQYISSPNDRSYNKIKNFLVIADLFSNYSMYFTKGNPAIKSYFISNCLEFGTFYNAIDSYAYISDHNNILLLYSSVNNVLIYYNESKKLHFVSIRNFKGYLNENELYLFMLEVVLEILNHNKIYFSAIEEFFNRRDNVFITDEQGITLECLNRLSKNFIE